MPHNPHANFSPTLEGYSGQTPFRYWCQMALPLTYDDSLSYYELLNKVVAYVNNTIEDVANVETNVGRLSDAYNQLQSYVNDYFDNIDIEQELRTVLDRMALDGSLDEILSPIVELQLPGVVEDQIEDVVEDQIGSVVASQIGGVVEEQLPPLVAENVPDEVTDWLNQNVDPVGSAVVVDSSLSVSNAAADAKVTGDLRENEEKINRTLFKIPVTPANMSMDENGKIFLDFGYVNQNTGYSSATASTSPAYKKYLRTQAGVGAGTFLQIGDKSLLITLDLNYVEWTCYSYSGVTNDSATHSNCNSKYIPGTRPIFVPKNTTDTRFSIGIRTIGNSDANRPAFTDEQISEIKNSLKFYVLTDDTLSEKGSGADAAVTGLAIYDQKNRTYNIPAAITWWEVPDTFSSENPIYPSDVPMNSYTAQLGSLFNGFKEKGVSIEHPDSVYYLFAWRSRHNSNIRFYQLFQVGYGEIHYVSSTDGGATLTVMNPPGRKPGAKILWLGDSIIRGRVGGENANYNYGIPYHVGRDLNIKSENFGIGNLGWISGYLPSTSPSKTNAFGYLKRIGNPDYYDKNDRWSGYKFIGSGDWNDFNTIVFSLGVNDVNYPLGSLSDIDDSLSYATVMNWKCSAEDSDSSDRTIVKAIYQCYRYIRESESMHSEGEPYVPGGHKINIILSDPIITGNTETGTAPEWSYNRTLSGGYTRMQLNQLLADFAQKYGCGHISNYDAPIDRMHLANSLPDGIHPNRETYDQLGKHFAGKISALVL